MVSRVSEVSFWALALCESLVSGTTVVYRINGDAFYGRLVRRIYTQVYALMTIAQPFPVRL